MKISIIEQRVNQHQRIKSELHVKKKSKNCTPSVKASFLIYELAVAGMT